MEHNQTRLDDNQQGPVGREFIVEPAAMTQGEKMWLERE
jgi:hypothetical protein